MYSDTATALVRHGISEYGYSYVNLDSGWQYKYGGKLDAIQPNPKFPDMKVMTDEIHSLGLKCGIYSTPMLTAWGCPGEYKSIPGCTQGKPDIRFAETNGGIGVIHKEENNARQWEEWGFDYLKYDWRPTDTVNAELMRGELMKLNRDFGFCITVNALYEYISYWSAYCNSYRNNEDSQGFWKNLLQIYETYEGYEKHMTKGHYYDLDMLDVGNCIFSKRENFLTEDEQIVSYSMRAFLNSPIQISAVLDEISDFDLAMYCNEEIIAINQDAAFAPSVPIFRYKKDDAILDVFEKLLEDGSYAYAFFNMGETSENVNTVFSEESNLRDVWAKENLGSLDSLTFTMPKHTVRIIKSEKKATSFSLCEL
jgi:alpha-galactosidase